MRNSIIFIVVALAIVFALSVWVDSRIAAGAGAVLLLGGLAYGTIRNAGGSRAGVARAERGAREVREEIAEDEERRGTN
ncbi:MAG: hypothetical protein JY451_04320 [Erythrobacter sp.]|nr:MAG: hypothetical protein JY451_04320 [Erythrobacter sp.]